MTCPSCNFHSNDLSPFCIRCSFPVAKLGPRLAAFRSTWTWVLRRSLSGFASGMAGWAVVAGANRAAGGSLGNVGHMVMTGFLGGIFLGTVEGMMEESSLKTWKGGILGAFGGLIGGLLSTGVFHLSSLSESSQGMLAIIVTWGVTGGAIGTVSAWLERHPRRLIAGALAGFLGGALGGWLGYQMYASLLDMAQPQGWFLKRLIEAFTGAILGAVLWSVLGLAEKLFIFKRRLNAELSKKDCDGCQRSNPLNAWYCGYCGAVLQVSAPPEKLQLPRRQALARVISACQYLGWLSGTTSFVIAGLAGIFLGSINVFLGLFGLLASALVGYIAYILFNSLAELVSPLL